MTTRSELKTPAEQDPRIAELRAEARAFESDPHPRVAYFAHWLGFFMDAHERALKAWRENVAD